MGLPRPLSAAPVNSSGVRSRVRRSRSKLVRYTPEELTAVIERARRAGRPVACYIRDASLGAAPRARRAPLSDDLIRELGRLGNHLAGIARTARARQLPGAQEFDLALTKLLDVIRQLG